MKTDLTSRRRFVLNGIAALYAGVGPVTVYAQSLVEQLRVLCVTPAGSVPDMVARGVAAQLKDSYPRGVLVDNRPGASGQIAIGALKAAPADGSTVLLAQGSAASAYRYLFSKLTFDPAEDLKPVSLGAEVTLGLAVGPLVPAGVGNLRELIEWMRSNPKLANAGSPGAGSPPHLLEAMLFREAGVAWEHIPFAGSPPAMAALLGGQIAALVVPEGVLRPHAASGKLRILATSGARRTAYLPDVPTLVEQGYPNLVVLDWFGFFVSGGVSAGVTEAMSQRLRVALGQPALQAAFAETGMVAVSSTPAVMAARIEADRHFWEPVIRVNGIRAG